MRTIKIKQIVLQNFKGVRDYQTDFGERMTSICGANATGKSTINDAFTWCLFGKDANDRTDSGRGAFSIKTIDANGNVIERLEHSVEVVLDVDGVGLTIKRELREKWTKQRGSTEVKFDGNETACFWNGVEIKISDYNKRIASELIEDDTFKTITNPLYFSSQPWERQKAMLAQIIGNVTYADIADKTPEFRAEYEKIKQGNHVGREDELRKSVQATIKRIRDDIKATTHQIEGMKELVPEMPDVDKLKEEKNDLNEELDCIEMVLRNRAELEKKKFEKVSKIQTRINEIRLQQSVIKNNALINSNKEREEKIAEKKNLQDLCERYESAIENYKCHIKSKEINMHVQEWNSRLKSQESDREQALEEFYKVAAEEYGDEREVICPITSKVCKDACMLEGKREIFEKSKEERLNMIRENGKKIAEAINQTKISMAEAQKEDDEKNAEIEKLKDKINKAQEELDIAKSRIDGIVIPGKVEDVDPATIPEYMKLEAEADKLEADIADVQTDKIDLTEGQKEHRAEIKARLTQIDGDLGVVDMIESQKKKIKEFEDSLNDMAQLMADAEQEEDVLLMMRKAVDEEIQRRCDDEFRFVKFKLSEQQINGGELATCYAMVDGVKYSDLNSAKKVNAGLDIINAICRHIGISAPIFIDNAEGINELEQTDSQMIRLVVTEDKELKVLK